MANDTYNSFAELTRHERVNKDYKISISNVGSPITIIAPHGGKIEPGTSDLAKMIAKENYNYYCFEGIKRKNNRCLHITSHNFNEPIAINILSRSKVVVAIHACTGNAGLVHLGGLDIELKKKIVNKLQTKGIQASMKHPKFLGSHPNNICNRGATGKGVQLEITRDLRDELKSVHLIAQAVQKALLQRPGWMSQDKAQSKRKLIRKDVK